MPLPKILDLSLMQKGIIGLVTELWSPGLLTEYIGMCFLPFAMSTMKMRRDCSHSGLEVGLSAFQLAMFAEGIPSTSALCLHYACIMPIPSLQLQKKTCLVQRSRGFVHRQSCGLQDLLRNIPISDGSM